MHTLQAQVLARQDQVLTNLASLDDQEAARAEGAAARWQVRLPIMHSHTAAHAADDNMAQL